MSAWAQKRVHEPLWEATELARLSGEPHPGIHPNYFMKPERFYLRRPDFAQQVGMPIQHFEQLHQRQRWLGLAVFVA